MYVDGTYDSEFDFTANWGHLNTNQEHTIGVWFDGGTVDKEGWSEGAVDEVRFHYCRTI